MVLQNYQNLIKMTSNIIYIVAFGVGSKCPHKIHLNTQCPREPFIDVVFECPPSFEERKSIYFDFFSRNFTCDGRKATICSMYHIKVLLKINCVMVSSTSFYY